MENKSWRDDYKNGQSPTITMVAICAEDRYDGTENYTIVINHVKVAKDSSIYRMFMPSCIFKLSNNIEENGDAFDEYKDAYSWAEKRVLALQAELDERTSKLR